MKKLIIIMGSLATGKSTVALKLSRKYKIAALIKDTMKEILSDTIGFTNRKENKNLSIAAVLSMKYFFSQNAITGNDLIVEANFHSEEIEAFDLIAEKAGYSVFTVFIDGEDSILFERFCNRIKNEKRHPTHMTADIMTYENFCAYLKSYRDDLKNIQKETFIARKDNYDDVFHAVENFIFPG